MVFPASDFKPRFDDIFYAPDFKPQFGERILSSTVTWVEWNGSQQPGTYNGTVVTTLNFGNYDGPDINSTIYPVRVGYNSYAKYVKAQFSGSFSSISNARVWKSAGEYNTGEGIKFSGSVIMTVPSTTSLSALVPSIPVALPSVNLILAGATTEGWLPRVLDVHSSPGYYSGSRSNLMVFQAQTTSSTPLGSMNVKTISLTYDRS